MNLPATESYTPHIHITKISNRTGDNRQPHWHMSDCSAIRAQTRCVCHSTAECKRTRSHKKNETTATTAILIEALYTQKAADTYTYIVYLYTTAHVNAPRTTSSCTHCISSGSSPCPDPVNVPRCPDTKRHWPTHARAASRYAFPSR